MIINMSNVVLRDAAATPVSHTFTPASRVAEGIARWVAKPASGALLGTKVLTLSSKEPTDHINGVYREKVSLSVPKLDMSVPTAPKLLATARFNGEFLLPAAFTTQEKKDFVKMVEQSFILDSATALGDNIVDGGLPY